MLVVARKFADRLKRNNTSEDFAVVRIVVPASTGPTIERVIDVTLCELRPVNGTARIGFEADRDIVISRMELVKH
jgi:hypothetical protein